MKIDGMSDRLLGSLISQEPLIGHYLFNSEIVQTHKLPGNSCAAIAIRNGQIILFLNPDRFLSLSDEEKAGVIVHEYLHIILEHVSARGTNGIKIAKILNVAQDMAINQLVIRSGLKLPSYVVFHNSNGYDFKSLQSAEYYYDELIKDIPKFEKIFGPVDSNDSDQMLDDHSGWSDSENSSSVIDELNRQYSECSDGVGKALAGTDKANLLATVKAGNDSNINWSTEIIHYINSSKSTDKRFAYNKINRKISNKDFFIPGKINTFEKSNVSAIVDVSGSMQPVMPNIIAELNRISTIFDIYVYFCDVEVTRVIEDFKVTSELSISGYGGTKLQPAFKKASEKDSKIVICFTDGHLSDQSLDTYDMEIIWVVYNNPTFLPNIGKVVRIEV